jgi:Protein of unknown function (DUF2490)
MACPSVAVAQASGQFWANATVDWLASDRLTYEFDVEPRTNPSFLKLMPHIDYAIVPWADLLAEVDLERKDGSGSSSTPRFGAQFHVLSRLLRTHARPGAEREKLPRRRLTVSTLLRAENANSSWRLRDRFDAAYSLNRHKTSDDGAVYVSSDVELFTPIERATGAALVSQMRVRAGIGYRESFKWRFEALYIWDGTRHADAGPLTTQSHAIDIRVRREF